MSMNYNAAVNITAHYSGEGEIRKASRDIGGLAGFVNKAGVALKALAAAYVVKETIEFGKRIIDLGDELGELRQKTGIGVQALSDLKTAAEKGGVEFGSLEVSLKKFSTTLGKAEGGSSQALAGFRALGLSLKDAQGNFKSSDDLLFEIADKFENIPDGADKSAAAVALFGRSGADLIPVLNGGSKAIKGMGVQMSEEFVKQADIFNDKITKLKDTVVGFGASILEKALPYMSQFVDYLSRVRIGAFGMYVLPNVNRDAKGDLGGPKTGTVDTRFLGGTKNGESGNKEADALKRLQAELSELRRMNDLERASVAMSSAEYEKHKIAIEENLKAEKALVTFKEKNEIAAYRKTTEAIIAEKQALIEFQEQQKRSFGAGAQEAIKAYSESVRNMAEQSQHLFTTAFQGIEDALTSFVTTGKLSFKSLADAVVEELARIAIRQAVIAPLLGLVGGLFNPAAAAGLGGGIGSAPISGMALGGIVGPGGSVPLQRYARGGIATGPQMALFGEGAMNEAYVPLPDGRRIPVAMQGGAGTTVVNVYMDGSGGKDSTTSSSAKGKQFGASVAAAVKQVIIQEKRPGGLLSG